MDEKLRHRFEALVDFALERGVDGVGDMTAVAGELTMLDVLQGFVHELRVAGLPVSMTENLDAMRAVEHVPLENRDTFKAALGATLVKHHGHAKVFDTVFEVYFSMFSPGIEARSRGAEGEGSAADFEQLRQAMEAAGAMGQVSNEELAEMLLDALDEHGPRAAARSSRALRWRVTRAWSRAARSAARTTSTGRCGSSTPKASSPR